MYLNVDGDCDGEVPVGVGAVGGVPAVNCDGERMTAGLLAVMGLDVGVVAPDEGVDVGFGGTGGGTALCESLSRGVSDSRKSSMSSNSLALTGAANPCKRAMRGRGKT